METRAPLPSEAQLIDELQRNNTNLDAPRSERDDYSSRTEKSEISIDLYKRAVCQIKCKTLYQPNCRPNGSGCLVEMEVPNQGLTVWCITAAHVIPKHYADDNDIRVLINRIVTFEQEPNAREATRKLHECVVRVIRMSDLDVICLELDPATAGFYRKELRVLNLEDVAELFTYAVGQPFYLLGHPDGKKMETYKGEIGPNSTADKLMPHNANTTTGTSGSVMTCEPTPEVKSMQVIGIHLGCMDLEQSTYAEKEKYCKRAVKIGPILEHLKQYYRNNPDPHRLEGTQQHDADNSTPRQTRSFAEETEQHQPESDESCPCPASHVDTSSIHTPTTADAEAMLASTYSTQPTAAASVSLREAGGDDVMSMISSVDARQPESRAMESGGEDCDD